MYPTPTPTPPQQQRTPIIRPYIPDDFAALNADPLCLSPDNGNEVIDLTRDDHALAPGSGNETIDLTGAEDDDHAPAPETEDEYWLRSLERVREYDREQDRQHGLEEVFEYGDSYYAPAKRFKRW